MANTYGKVIILTSFNGPTLRNLGFLDQKLHYLKKKCTEVKFKVNGIEELEVQSVLAKLS